MREGETSYLVIPSTGTRIPVPDGDDFDPAVIRAEHEALAAHPQVRARTERARRNRAEGKGIAAEALYRELGYTPPDRRPAKEYNGRLLFRMPASVHRDLAERAAAEGTTINQLILHYVSQGLGREAANRRPQDPGAAQS